MTDRDWIEIATAAHGNPFEDRPKIVIMVSRYYGGAYECGRFVAIHVDDIDGAAFADDTSAAANWWQYNGHRCGGGNTPNDALLDWYKKRQGVRKEDLEGAG